MSLITLHPVGIRSELKQARSSGRRGRYATLTWRTADPAPMCWSACRRGKPHRPDTPHAIYRAEGCVRQKTFYAPHECA